jgi:hypothetical protein
MGMFGVSELFIILLVLSLMIVLPILALVDILRSQFNGNDKLIWVLVILFLPVIGSILYLSIGKNQKIR